MIEASRERILSELSDEALVLDVGGWAHPFDRADWVIDLMPYETRGLYLYDRDHVRERFDASTWVETDICAREPWPFENRRFDFAVCSHTLEDVRDPVWVCSELVRVARAGYVEVPSRLQEQTYGVQGPWVGWSHHHWLVDVDCDSIEFVFKHSLLNGRSSDHLPAGTCDGLADEHLVQTLWWRDEFSFRERIMVTPEQVDSYLAEFVAAHRAAAPRRSRPWRRASR